jgi:hypothetical protein
MIYRLLVEVDRNGNEIENVAVLDIYTEEIEWFDTVHEALIFIDDNGSLISEDE